MSTPGVVEALRVPGVKLTAEMYEALDAQGSDLSVGRLLADAGKKLEDFVPIILQATDPEKCRRVVHGWTEHQEALNRAASRPILQAEASSSPRQNALEEAVRVANAFIESVRASGGLMPDGGMNRKVLSASAAITRMFDRYPEYLRSQLLKDGGQRGEVEAFIRAVERHVTGRALRLIPAAEFMTRADPRYLIEGLVEEGGLAVVYGEAEACKTFIVLAWCVCIAAGIPWIGRSVIQGPVVYVGAEGGGGLPKRLWALVEHYDLGEPPPDLYIIDQVVNVLDALSVAEAVAAVEDFGIQPALVVLDTYARSMVGGDENSAKDAGLAIQAMDRLRFSLKTAVLAVHHLGKTGTSERGSGALRGAADSMLLVSRDTDAVFVSVEKQKNFEHGPRVSLRLQAVRDSLVLVELVLDRAAQWEKAANPKPDRREDKLLKIREAIIAALEQAETDGRTPITQTRWLEPIKGFSMEAKIDMAHELAADPESRVAMEEKGNSKLYSLNDSIPPTP